MKTQTRKAVSPIIATLLLIAITVAAGVVVYVFVGGLSANLSKSGGNQVTEQISQDAYTFTSPTTSWTITLRNTGTAAVTLAGLYYNGVPVSSSTAYTSARAPYSITDVCGVAYTTTNSTVAVGTACSLTFTLDLTGSPTASASGTSNQLKVVTLDGAIFTFNVIAGSSG